MNDTPSAFQNSPSWFPLFVFIGPLAAFFAVGSVLPMLLLGLDASDIPTSETPTLPLWVTTIRVVSMLAIVAIAAPTLLKAFPLQISWISIPVGIAGGVIWIGLCGLELESSMLTMLGLSPDFLGQRDALDPWALYPDTTQRTYFLIARFCLLVIAVPMAEELMLRGCLIRYVEADHWETLPISQIGRTGLITATLYGVLSHPSEWIAAAVWFSLITWMMVRTQRLWDCIVAHALTNAVLGIYIVATGTYDLW